MYGTCPLSDPVVITTHVLVNLIKVTLNVVITTHILVNLIKVTLNVARIYMSRIKQ